MKLAAKLVDLTKTYFLGENVVRALRGVSAEFPEGDFVAIMGSSGSGKSTMLNLLGALDRPTSGKYILSNYDVSTLNDDQLSEIRNRLIGFIFQSYNLIAQYTVLENIQVPFHYRSDRRVIGSAEMNRTIDLASKVGLGERLDHRPFQLSGGQQQRVAIARALAMHPEIILFDEPTSALDPRMAAEVLEVISDLAGSGQTMVVVTHSMPFARQLATTIHVFGEGRVVESGPPDQILENPGCETTRLFLNQAEAA